MTVCVIGVGSGFGDDAVGLAVVDWLAARALPAGVALAHCERPLPDLLDACEGASACVLIDAMRSGAAPGAVRRIDARAIDAGAAATTHGFGTARALALGAALGRAPARVAWIGVEIGPVEIGAVLSESARAAIPVAGRLALDLAREIGEFDADRSRDS